MCVSWAKMERAVNQRQRLPLERARDLDGAEDRSGGQDRPGAPASHRRRLFDLVGLDFPEPEARRHLRRIDGNRDELSRALGREVSLAVAALDHFTRWPQPGIADLRVVDRSALDRLAGLARTDALTGLLNRRGLEPVLESAAALAQRTGTPL